MEEILREKYLSSPRFKRYLLATGNQEDKAKKLYVANLRLAQAFHPIVSQFEVVLRNALNKVLTNYFSDPDWIINQRTGFMNNPTLASSDYFLRESIFRTVRQLRRQNIPITTDKIISNQMFGFWLAFFLPHHYTLVEGRSIAVFGNKPLSENRASLHSRLKLVRDFRNRMNHCEPLCFRGNTIDCTTAQIIHAQLYDLIRWINPDLIPYFESIDKVPVAIDLLTKI